MKQPSAAGDQPTGSPARIPNGPSHFSLDSSELHQPPPVRLNRDQIPRSAPCGDVYGNGTMMRRPSITGFGSRSAT
jgi:hypothetical protein